MKRVLITGKNSYIGTKVEKYLEGYGYQVDTLDMVCDDWENFDFNGYTTVVHVAGIAHQNNVPDELYDNVNHHLAVKVASVASEAGVDQFVFLSSGAVFSQNDKKHRVIVVDEKTDLVPLTPYGISKLKAEEGILGINSKMKIAIIRPPMVYGPGAKGNYNLISKLAKSIIFVPKVNNKRSMIFIDNLSALIELIIRNSSSGIFMPQNKEYVNTSELIYQIAKVNNKKVYLFRGFEWAVILAGRFSSKINKAFGTFIYKHPDAEYFNGAYQIVDFKESIFLTENVVK